MKYRTLGNTGLRVSVIGMGTWQFGGEWGKTFSQQEVTAMFRAAVDAGINLVDTAECYGDHLSEHFIGKALHELSSRQNFILATKFGHRFHAPFERTEPRSPADVQTQLEDSLRALHTDYIDLYQYHSWPDSQYADDDVASVLIKARAAGKIRHIGNSIGPNNQPRQVEHAPPCGIESLQIIYNRLDTAPEEYVFPLCDQLGIGVMARVPLASGFLSGKYAPATKFPTGDVRARAKPERNEQRLQQAQEIQRSEVPPDVSMSAWALAWCLKHPVVQCVIPGCKSAEQVASNAAAADLDMVDPHHPWSA